MLAGPLAADVMGVSCCAPVVRRLGALLGVKWKGGRMQTPGCLVRLLVEVGRNTSAQEVAWSLNVCSCNNGSPVSLQY